MTVCCAAKHTGAEAFAAATGDLRMRGDAAAAVCARAILHPQNSLAPGDHSVATG